MFDARVFNIPKEEVTNNIYWRQLDASRNSIQMLGQAYFSHKELQHKTCNQIQDMLMTQKEINWNDLPSHQKRGSCCVKNRRIVSISADRTETCELRDLVNQRMRGLSTKRSQYSREKEDCISMSLFYWRYSNEMVRSKR